MTGGLFGNPESRTLYKKVIKLSEFFGDMLFQPGTITFPLIQYRESDENDFSSIEFQPDGTHILPDELEYFAYDYVNYEVNDTLEGRYDPESNTLSVSSENLKKEYPILHEMIHLHEEAVNKLPLYFHDMILWALYQDLRDKIEGLDDALNKHSRLQTVQGLYDAGGLHDTLFILKSLDLDIRNGFPLGTVFAYGRTETFKDLKLKSE